MRTGLLLHNDHQVAEYLFQNHVIPRMQYDVAIGILTDGVLSGGILLQSWNGFNVELSYYGQGSLTPGIIRCLARILISGLNPSRVTVTVRRKNRVLMRGLRKLGFAVEGTQRRYYGNEDLNRNTGVRFVMFRERVEQLAQLERRAAG
jgi:RimJ/RimL family protein N-acetyltransferase